MDSRFDVIKALRDHWRVVARITVLVTMIVVVFAGLYFASWQPVTRATALEFRPTFRGVERDQYPNGLPFGPGDVLAPSIVDRVFEQNSIKQYCSSADFRAGFYVERRSDASVVLDAEYQARLTDSRLTAVERDALMREYAAKRAALPVGFRLVYVHPRGCGEIPQVVVTKVMDDLLSTWATESDERRGVLAWQVDVLTPAFLNEADDSSISVLVRADSLRASLAKVIGNIDQVSSLPGAGLIRLETTGMSLTEIHSNLEDLIRLRLEPLVVAASRASGRSAANWIREVVLSTRREQKAAEARALAYQDALQRYSGQAMTTAQSQRMPSSSAGTGSNDLQTLTPVIDATFIDRILGMSETNTVFRQELTDQMVQAQIAAVDAELRSGYYERLLNAVGENNGFALSLAEVTTSLADVVERAKALTLDFNRLYDQFSAVSIRPAASMYQTEKPAREQAFRTYSLQDYLMTVIAAFFVTFSLTLLVCVLRQNSPDASRS